MTTRATAVTGSMQNTADRLRRLTHLRSAWRADGASWPLATLREALALAAAWRDWPMVARAGSQLCDADALAPGDALLLVQACRALGLGDQALGLVQALPRQHAPATLEADLRAWLAWRARFPPVTAAGDLMLEPLAHHHAGDFALQYADPDIAALCCLPRFGDALDWHAWLAGAWRDGNRLLHAVLHREWGFTGCVSLAIHGQAGFFYYWMGRDFQGRGFGPRAGALLLETAERACGLRACYAKAYDYNLRSRRGLEKMGFADLGMRGASADSNQVFYRRGLPLARRQVIGELDMLLDSMDAQVRPGTPAQAGIPA